ncbi:MAG: GntR family transcriptional regulator [Steroidobacteraceae bacterium]
MDKELFIIRPAAPEPIYRQIMEQLRRLIASGQLTPGESLPSVREIAGHHAVNPMTVSRAYGQLEAEGLLERQRGKGMVVAATRKRPQSHDQRMDQLEPRLRELARQVRELDLSAKQVIDRLRSLMDEEK